MSQSLKLIYDSIISKKREDINFWIPEPWVTGNDVKILERKNGNVRVEPYQYLKAQFDVIMQEYEKGIDYRKSLSNIRELPFEDDKISLPDRKRLPGDWLAVSSIYGLYIRSFTAFDHNMDGELGGSKSDVTLSPEGVRETGTFLKAIALLPYIKELGFDTVYLLPVAVNGKANRKGELGSPYGVRNPFKIDPIYHDPLVDEYDADMEFKAFIQAAHVLGLRVLLDFVPRTASRDSDFIKEHPDWFYWIKKDVDANYHSPEFTQDELRDIHYRVSHIHDTKERHMVPPHADYIAQFTEPPTPDNISYAGEKEGYVGKVGQQLVVVPGAFADWPPDDIQPPWTDVTYLKLYDDKDFNYVAYNTIRMYDGRIRRKNEALWDSLGGMIPYYQEEFGLDGARIDMGHALPHDLEIQIIERARSVDPDFAFLSEDFNPWARARENGYNIVMSNSWWTFPRTMVGSDNGDSVSKQFIKNLPNYPNPVLGSPETADTPRAASRKGGIKFSKAVWLLATTLPNMVPFCPAGFELGDKRPTNLGLDFTMEEIEALSKNPLAFFDRASLSWDSDYRKEMREVVLNLNSFRADNLGNILHLDNFSWVECEVDGQFFMSPQNPVISFMRMFHEQYLNILTSGIFGEELHPVDVDKEYLVVVNMDCENEVIVTLKQLGEKSFQNIFTEENYKTVADELNLRLKPGDGLIAIRTK